MSAWSEAWAHSHGFNSVLTSPADDVPITEDDFPCSQPHPPHLETEHDEVAFARFMDGPGSMDELIELPAEVPTSLNVAENNETTEATPSGVDTVMRYDLSPVIGESQQHVGNLKRGSRQLGAHALI